MGVTKSFLAMPSAAADSCVFKAFCLCFIDPVACWPYDMQDGTDDTSPSSATVADDASDSTAAPAQALPSSSTPEDEDSSMVDEPSANGFHLPNGSAATDSDGFRRQHERRPSANANGRPGPHRADYQPSDDSFR